MLLKGIDLIFRGLMIFKSPFLTEMDNGMYIRAVRQRTINALTTIYFANGSFAKYNAANSKIRTIAVRLVLQVLSFTFFLIERLLVI